MAFLKIDVKQKKLEAKYKFGKKFTNIYRILDNNLLTSKTTLHNMKHGEPVFFFLYFILFFLLTHNYLPLINIE